MFLNLLVNVNRLVINYQDIDMPFIMNDIMSDIMHNIIAIITIITPFVVALMIIFIVVNSKSKKDKMRAAERMKMIEKGIVPPMYQSHPVVQKMDYLIPGWIKLLLGFGLGLFFGMILERLGFDNDAAYFSMIFICMSLTFIFADSILSSINKKKEDTIPASNSIANKPKNKKSKNTDTERVSPESSKR